jgi:hypothetical protein
VLAIEDSQAWLAVSWMGSPRRAFFALYPKVALGYVHVMFAAGQIKQQKLASNPFPAWKNQLY